MESLSTYKLLFLLNLLSKNSYTKNQIIEKFKENNLKITKSLITNYINKFDKNDIAITTKINNKKEKIYSLKNENIKLNFSQKELNAISDIKKILISQKDYTKIRKTMRLFYKLARYIKDENQQLEFLNFGYYSTINWNLVRILENHCKQKDIIIIDYLMPNGENKAITIHVDEIKINKWSQRIYLYGVFENSNRFSHLPIDNIFMVKKVKQKNVRFNLITDTMTYTVGISTYKEFGEDPSEKIIEILDNDIKIQRPIDDEFNLVQRLLYFCPEIKNITNSKIKNLLKEKLLQVKNLYE